jgi:hypothetical protein
MEALALGVVAVDVVEADEALVEAEAVVVAVDAAADEGAGAARSTVNSRISATGGQHSPR